MPDCHWSACPGDRRPGQDLNGLSNSHANSNSSKRYGRPGQDVKRASDIPLMTRLTEKHAKDDPGKI